MTDTVQLLLLCCGSILVGGVFIYLLFLRRKPETHTTEQEEKKQQEQSDQREANNAIASIATSKKQAKSKKRREAQQEFTHSWMVGALKGHTGPVLHIDFSANGKFLASCAEEAAGKSSTITKAKKLQQQPQPPPSPSGSSKSSSSSSSDKEPQRTILSRRQRKNRTRAPRRDHDDDRPPPPLKQDKKAHHQQEKAKQPVKKPKTIHSKKMASNGGNDCGKHNDNSSKKVNQHHQHHQHSSDSFSKPSLLANFSDADLSIMLKPHILDPRELQALGYAWALTRFPEYVVFFYESPAHGVRLHHHRVNNLHERKPGAYNLDANAREFVPQSWASIVSCERDSGRGSSGSSSLEGSDPEQESSSDSDKCHKSNVQDVIARRCVRCRKGFYVLRKSGDYLYKDKCCYHWGKFRNSGWECCGASESWRGCTSASAHVWSGVLNGRNGPFVDFVKTVPARHIPLDGNYGAYAMDCEMCFTKRGLEVGRVSLVDLNGIVVYETMVKPAAEIIDYNTRFSGLHEQDFVNAKSLHIVQQELKRFIFAETILIGHGLENDLRALRLLHYNVIDTTVLYPHQRGLPYKNSLKTLALHYLNKVIQRHEHDSAEDARVALDLVYLKLIEKL